MLRRGRCSTAAGALLRAYRTGALRAAALRADAGSAPAGNKGSGGSGDKQERTEDAQGDDAKAEDDAAAEKRTDAKSGHNSDDPQHNAAGPEQGGGKPAAQQRPAREAGSQERGGRDEDSGRIEPVPVRVAAKCGKKKNKDNIEGQEHCRAAACAVCVGRRSRMGGRGGVRVNH